MIINLTNRFSNNRNWSLSYECANESVPGIVAGLDLMEGDRILAICGSGDQAFAMLEYAGFVQAVDRNPVQIGYAQKRVRQIRDGDFDSFHSVGYMWNDTRFAFARRNYFTEDRLERIRGRLDCLVITEVDIFDIHHLDGEFNKFYFSNVYFFFQIVTSFRNLITSQPVGGLIYAVLGAGNTSSIPELIVDSLLTDRVREIESSTGYKWRPTILRRVAE
ncbi:class I SAM-dependent methyltransferase [Candidatus Woesearchaeota archaeon]|nr:class I SAM-dependent methyltransferase [Candidatus Woesearchaeota archaeon]